MVFFFQLLRGDLQTLAEIEADLALFRVNFWAFFMQNFVLICVLFIIMLGSN